MAAVKHVKMSESQESRLIDWLSEKLTWILDSRQTREDGWRKYRELYEGPRPSVKEFPWRGASNVHVPVTGIIVDAVHANLMNRLYTQENVFTVDAGMIGSTQVGVNPDDAQPITIGDAARKSQSFLNHKMDDVQGANFYSVFEQGSLEAVKLGTSVIHMPWVTLTQSDFRLDDASGEVVRGDERVVYDGVRPKLISLEDFMILPGYSEVHGPEGSPLVGHRYWLRSGEIRARRDWFRRDAMMDTLKTYGGDDDLVKDAQEQRDGGVLGFASEVRGDDHELFDLWIRFPLYEDRPEISLFVTYSKKARRILRVQPFIYSSIPYVTLRYIRRENRFYGIGIPELLESIQEGTNTSFNQAVDNVTVANMRCFKVRSGTRAARTFGSVYPGKKFIVDNDDDLGVFQLGEVYPSAFQPGLLFRDLAERRTGITDFNLGRESDVLGKGAPASSVMALLQESSRRFDLYARDMRLAMGELGMQFLELHQQHKAMDQVYEVMGPDGELVEQLFSLPKEINLRRYLTVNAASLVTSNKEIARQNAVTVFGIVSQYMEKLMGLGQLMISPEVPPPLQQLAYKVSQTGERLMQRLLADFDQHDLAAFLPQMEGLLNGGGQAPTINAAPGMGGPEGVPVGGQDPLAGAAPIDGGPGGFDPGGLV